jgi:hypothetical protein
MAVGILRLRLIFILCALRKDQSSLRMTEDWGRVREVLKGVGAQNFMDGRLRWID